MKIRKIQVVCPADAVTGGPESLHNLVAVLKDLGEEASIVYYPFGSEARTPAPYLRYRCNLETLDDSPETLVIVPEIYYSLTKTLREAKTAIWWLSLDNFLERKYHSWRDTVRYLIKVVKRERPVFGLKGIKCDFNLSKSHYDETYLKLHGIEPVRLTGPISSSYLEMATVDRIDQNQREKIILYNAKKGTKHTKILRNAFPEWNFVALEGMNERELAAMYLKSMIYIDFGHHPGRERMPREAAIMGCCVVTGRLGSAANDFDIPIPSQFKIDQFGVCFVGDFKHIVEKIFNDFEEQTKLFNSYRREILEEPNTQKSDLLGFLHRIRADL